MSTTAVLDVVKNGEPFQNPAATAIADTSAGSTAASGKVATDLAAVNSALLLNPTDPHLLQQHADLTALESRFAVLGGGPVDPGLPPFYALSPSDGLSFVAITTHTNFFSGVDSVPPIGFETQGLSFLNVLGAASSMKTVAKELGETPEDDPCKSVNDLLGSVLGKMAEMLGPLLDLLNGFVNALMTAANMLALIDNYINNIWQILNDEVNLMKQYLSDLAAYALSKFLNNIIKDPCLAAVLGAIGTPALQQAIAEAPIIPS